MKETRLYARESWLRERYFGEGLSAKKMGALCGVKACTVKKHMRRLNIPLRSFTEARHMNYPNSQYRNKKFLYKKYWKQNHTLREIAALCGRDRKTISAWMDEFEIPRRSRAEWRTKERHHHSLISKFLSGTKRIAKSLNDYLRVQNTRDN